MADELNFENIFKLKVDGLKQELGKRGLTKSGTKAELQERLLNHLTTNEISEITAKETDVNLENTNEGENLLEASLDKLDTPTALTSEDKLKDLFVDDELSTKTLEESKDVTELNKNDASVETLIKDQVLSDITEKAKTTDPIDAEVHKGDDFVMFVELQQFIRQEIKKAFEETFPNEKFMKEEILFLREEIELKNQIIKNNLAKESVIHETQKLSHSFDRIIKKQSHITNKTDSTILTPSLINVDDFSLPQKTTKEMMDNKLEEARKERQEKYKIFKKNTHENYLNYQKKTKENVPSTKYIKHKNQKKEKKP
jgi:hypothetical protein